MKKALAMVVVSLSFFSACHKMPGGGCDPGMMGQQTYDVGFYRGPDMRQEADFVVVDGNKMPTQLGVGASNADCTTQGVLHVNLSYGTHTISFFRGEQGTSQTLVLSASGASLDGQPLALQTCNNGHSILVEDM